MFELAFGDKVPRKTPIQNEAYDEEFRRFEGSVNLMVWCTWRLDIESGCVVSSDGDDDEIGNGLRALMGSSVTEVSIVQPAWDLVLRFNGGMRLTVFCDHVGRNPSYDGNWYLTLPDRLYYAGPGTNFGIEDRGRDMGR